LILSGITSSFARRLTRRATANVRPYSVAQQLLASPAPATKICHERWNFCGLAARRLLPAGRSHARHCRGTKCNNQPLNDAWKIGPFAGRRTAQTRRRMKRRVRTRRGGGGCRQGGRGGGQLPVLGTGRTRLRKDGAGGALERPLSHWLVRSCAYLSTHGRGQGRAAWS
jgi:hypothetical protein